jgi:predicted membrane protein
MTIHHPSLIEPTTKYYLYEKLQQCHTTRANIYSFIINISIITVFIGFVAFLLYTLYVNKPTEEEQRQKNLMNQHAIMNKIREFRTVPAKITNLTEHYHAFDLLPRHPSLPTI